MAKSVQTHTTILNIPFSNGHSLNGHVNPVADSASTTATRPRTRAGPQSLRNGDMATPLTPDEQEILETVPFIQFVSRGGARHWKARVHVHKRKYTGLCHSKEALARAIFAWARYMFPSHRSQR